MDRHPEMPRVPSSFLSELQRLDPALCIKWNALRHRYAIVERGRSGDRIVRNVEGEDGRFLPLDKRTIHGLMEQDAARYGHGRPQDYYAHFDTQAKEQKAGREKQFKTNVHDILQEAKPQIAGTPMVSKP
jgi:hypothetical protein